MQKENKHPYWKIKNKPEYDFLLEQGFFFEFYPELTGNWYIDTDIIEQAIKDGK